MDREDSPERTGTARPEGGGPAPPRQGIRWGRTAVVAFLVLAAVVAGLSAALVVANRGQRVVLDVVLSRIRHRLAGTLTVDAIRSPSLLGGATLVGVHLTAADDRPFFDADSVVLRYSLLRVATGQPRVGEVTVFGPKVEISRYPGEEEGNVARILAADSSSDGSGAPGLALGIGDVVVKGGIVEVLSPTTGDVSVRVPTVPSPVGEGRLRRLAFGGLDLTLSDVRFQAGSDSVITAQVVDLASDVSILDRPLHVVGASGHLRYGPTGFHLDSAEVRFPGSKLDGTLSLGPVGPGDQWAFRLNARTVGAAELADLTWLDDRVPPGTWRGGVTLSAGSVLDVTLQRVSIQLEASSLYVDGGVELGDRLSLKRLEVRANPLAVSRLEPWLGRSLPLEGWLSGRANLSGGVGALTTEGRVTLVSTGHSGGPTTADFRGVVHMGSNPGVTDFHLIAAPLNFGTAGAFVPAARLSGTGRMQLDAAGRVDDGIRFVADIGHEQETPSASRILARGSLRRGAGGRWVTDVQSDLSPLSLGVFAGAVPTLHLRGDVHGSLRFVGPLDSLRVNGTLQDGDGTATVAGTFDALAPASGYSLRSQLQDVDASRYVETLPSPTLWTGRLDVEGRGAALDSLDARVSLVASRSRVGGLHVDTVSARMRAANGVLTVDTIDADLGGVRLSGGGEIGMTRSATGEAKLTFDTDNLEGLRPIFRGDVVTARDSLSGVALELLRMEGVDVDTLPTLDEVAMSGSARGQLSLSGSLDTLNVTGSADLSHARFGTDSLTSARLSLDLNHVLSGTREGRVNAQVSGLAWAGRSFQEVVADLRVNGRRAAGTVAATRVASEHYEVAGAVVLDTLGGGQADLSRATFAVDSLAWHLTQPASLRWTREELSVKDFSLARQGPDPMTLTADGTLAKEGTSDFNVRARGLHLDRLASIAQIEALNLGGHLDLDLSLTGPAATPSVKGSFGILEPRYGDVALDSVSGEITYQDQVADLKLDASEDGRRVFSAGGTVPVDLALDARGSRVLNRPMDVRVTADSLDAAVALSYLNVLQDVTGVVSGDFHIAGTLDRPEPSGVLRLDNAAWSIDALGVRHTGVKGSLTLNADRTVDVSLGGTGGEGTSTISGQVTLEPLNDPKLDLTIAFRNFSAVSRRDVAARVSGEMRLDSTYLRPLLHGNLTVDEGTLFLDEFVRSADVVDLSDPRFGLTVDTLAFAGRPLLADINNPFLQNLRANVTLSMPRNGWLRSEDMNVEMGGDLIVSYDRAKRDIVMVGELQALRGSYSVLGRRFDVESGTVGFPGTPGINPTLNIQAVTRIRRTENPVPLPVTATVAGTLTQPRVTLSTDEQGVAQSDLVSYLIFGRPSYQVATAQSAVGGGAAGQLAGAAYDAGVTYFGGELANTLGAALSRQIGLDYLSISRQGQYGVAQGLLNSAIAGTQVEVGQYIGDDVFVVLIFRTPTEQAGTHSNYFGGARVEVQLTDQYNVQGFWEDASLRSQAGGFAALGEDAKVIGVFIFRDWGY